MFRKYKKDELVKEISHWQRRGLAKLWIELLELNEREKLLEGFCKMSKPQETKELSKELQEIRHRKKVIEDFLHRIYFPWKHEASKV